MHSPDELGPLVGRGRSAEVFAWGEGQVAKLFYVDQRPGGIQRESHAAEVLAELPVPAPRYHGTIQLNDRTGLVFDRVVGCSMLSQLERQPWRGVAIARRLADVHLRIHDMRATDLPGQREFARQRIERASDLSAEARRAALERLEQLPDGDRLCHGDFHPDNVVIMSSGPRVLDWMNAVQGDPAGDVARTLLLLGEAELPTGASLAMKLITIGLRRLLVAVYWRRYAQQSGMQRAEVDAWRMPLLAARLAEGIPPVERRKLLRALTVS